MSDNTYSIKMYCGNCKENNMVEFARGTLVEDSDEECPTCGCKGKLARVIEPVVERVPVPTWPLPYREPYWWYGAPGSVGVSYSIETTDNTAAVIRNTPIGDIGMRVC